MATTKPQPPIYLKPSLSRPLYVKKQTLSMLKQLSAGLVLHNGWIINSSEMAHFEALIEGTDDLLKPQAEDFSWVLEMTKQLKNIATSQSLSNDELIMSLEACAVFAYQLHRSESLLDCVAAVVSFVHGTFQKSVCSSISTHIIDRFRKLFVSLEPQGMMDDFSCPNAETFFTQLRGAFDFTQDITKLPIMMKLHKFVLYVLSYSMLDRVGVDFETFGYSTFEAEAIRKAHCSKAGFWLATFDALTLFCKQFVCSVRSGSFTPFFHSAGTYEKWCVRAFELKRQENFLSNPAPHNFNIFSFRADYNEAIEQGEVMLKTMMSTTKLEVERFRALLNDLKMIKARDITRRSSQMEREAPFGLLLAGGSSVGKSHLTNILHQYFADLWDLPSGSDFKYTRNFTEEFWNGFTSSMWFVVLDDIASWSPSLGVMDPSMAEVIQVMNNVAFVPNQADLVDKGKTPFLARFVVATTNSVDLNAHAYFSCPLAIQRRLPFVVEVEPKKEFAQANGIMLDSSKCVLRQGEFNDYWSLRVSRVVPANDAVAKQRGVRCLVHTFDKIEDFLVWFGCETQKHHDQQQSLLAAEEDMKTIKICKICKAPQYSCVCGAVVPEVEWQAQAMDELVAANTTQCGGSSWFTFADFESVLYTMFAICYTAIGWLPLFTFPFSIIAYFCPTYRIWSAELLASFALEERFMRFLMRRIGARTQERFAVFIVYGKLLTLAVGMAYVVKGIHSAILPKPIQVVVQCLKCQQAAIEASAVESGGLAEQGALDDAGKAPVSTHEERVNVWYQSDFNVSSFDIDTLTMSWKDKTPDFVRNVVFKSLVRFRFGKPDGGWRNTGGLSLGGQLYAFNLHSLPVGDIFPVTMTSSPNVDGLSTNVNFTCTLSQIVKFVNCDVCIIYVPNVPPRKDLTRLLAKDTFDGKYVAEYVSLTSNMISTRNPVRNVRKTTYTWGDQPHTVWSGVSEILTTVGDCGGVLLSHTPSGPVILGLHALGSAAHDVVATLVTSNMVEQARIQLCALNVQSGEPELTVPGCIPYTIGPLHPKSPFRWQKFGVAKVYGSLSGHRAHPKSRVSRTLLADAAEAHGFEQKFGPPEMKSWRVWSQALDDLVNIPMTFRQDILEECVESFSEDIISRLSKEDLETVHVYDEFTAVNGAAGITYVDKMSRSTSAGFPWNKPKSNFLHAVPPRGELMDPVEFCPEVREKVSCMIETYKSGQRCMPVFRAHLKDEPTKFAKIEACKTRVFCGGPQDFGLVGRMYLLSVIRLIQNNRFVFEAGPGTIAQSAEWGEIRDYITFFGSDRLVAGDFKAFDKSMSSLLVLSAFRVVRNICVAAGYTEEELAVVDGISLDTAFPLVDMNGDLVELFGSNPSGHFMTVIINGLVHSLYMRYAFLVLNPRHECRSFREDVHLFTYGDDGVMGVSRKNRWFNHTTVQRVLASHGVTYTMADKLSQSVPFVRIEDVTFLKRSWLWSDEVANYLAPLDHESIEKSIMTSVVSRCVSPEYQAISIASSAWQEYFFYGREAFEVRTRTLLSVIEESGLTPYMDQGSFPTWDELVDRFHAYPLSRTWRQQLGE